MVSHGCYFSCGNNNCLFLCRYYVLFRHELFSWLLCCNIKRCMVVINSEYWLHYLLPTERNQSVVGRFHFRTNYHFFSQRITDAKTLFFICFGFTTFLYIFWMHVCVIYCFIHHLGFHTPIGDQLNKWLACCDSLMLHFRFIYDPGILSSDLLRLACIYVLATQWFSCVCCMWSVRAPVLTVPPCQDIRHSRKPTSRIVQSSRLTMLSLVNSMGHQMTGISSIIHVFLCSSEVEEFCVW